MILSSFFYIPLHSFYRIYFFQKLFQKEKIRFCSKTMTYKKNVEKKFAFPKKIYKFISNHFWLRRIFFVSILITLFKKLKVSFYRKTMPEVKEIKFGRKIIYLKIIHKFFWLKNVRNTNFSF